jgi:hypothetical protein
MPIRMWFVETSRGTLNPFYNLDDAKAEAAKRGTRYWDTETRAYYSPDGVKDDAGDRRS